MVFFTCNHCGSSLKKNKVEKHYAVECRASPAVSCMDCLKDFYGQEYVSHTKCISEEQKYSGQPANGNAQMCKGEKKQMEWVEAVRDIIDTKGSSLTPQERQLLEKLKDFENIPRKKKKFENFLKNAMGRYVDPLTIEKVWSLLEEHKSDAATIKESSVLSNSEKEADEVQQQPKEEKTKKKNKANEEVSDKVKEHSKDEGEVLPVAIGDANHKSKKKNKSHVVEEDNNNTELSVEKGSGTKKNKHSNRKHENSELEVSVSETHDEVPKNNVKEPGVDEGVEDNGRSETSQKLSKKERKERKKKLKYEAELESVSKEKPVVESDKIFEQDMELDSGEIQAQGNEITSKKSKKLKKKEKVKEEASNEDNAEVVNANGIKSADKKKRKHTNDNEEESVKKKKVKGGDIGEDDKKKKLNEAPETDVNGETVVDTKNKGKFKWDRIITSVLKSVPDNELPVKRLRKKVLAEYQEAVGSGKCLELSFEEALGMFERKLHKIPGVKVHKDKAKLVTSS